MKDVQSEELSALLDGELDAERARQVEMQIAADPTLRMEFEVLRNSDAAWRHAAATAMFAPTVWLPASARPLGQISIAVMLAGVLIVLRIAPKLMGSLVFGFGLHAVSLSVLLIALVWLEQAGPTQEHKSAN